MTYILHELDSDNDTVVLSLSTSGVCMQHQIILDASLAAIDRTHKGRPPEAPLLAGRGFHRRFHHSGRTRTYFSKSARQST
jgi:hypothetical protein